ncbi:MAG: hypothetical protein AB1652_09665 [Bacillota bacterium]
MLWEILLALAGGWLVFALGRVFHLFWAGKVRQAPGRQKLCKLFVLMGGQEDAAEGFLRKLMAWRNRLWPRLEVAVVDCGAGDDTGKIIRLLARELAYPVLEGAFFGRHGEQAAAGCGRTFLCYDARRHKGKDLIRAPLFCFLKEEIAVD